MAFFLDIDTGLLQRPQLVLYERSFCIATAGCMTGVFSATCAAYEEIVRAIVAAQWVVRAQWSEHWHLETRVKGSGFESNWVDANFPPFPVRLVTLYFQLSLKQLVRRNNEHTIAYYMRHSACTYSSMTKTFPNQILFTTLTLTAIQGRWQSLWTWIRVNEDSK